MNANIVYFDTESAHHIYGHSVSIDDHLFSNALVYMIKSSSGFFKKIIFWVKEKKKREKERQSEKNDTHFLSWYGRFRTKKSTLQTYPKE